MYYFRITLQPPLNHSLSNVRSRPITASLEKSKLCGPDQKPRSHFNTMDHCNEITASASSESESVRTGSDEETPSVQTAKTLLEEFLERRAARAERRAPREEQSNQDAPVDKDQPAIPPPQPAPINLDPIITLGIYLGTHTNPCFNPQLSAQGYVPHTELYTGLWSNVSSST
jgi:hypothetical protein